MDGMGFDVGVWQPINDGMANICMAQDPLSFAHRFFLSSGKSIQYQQINISFFVSHQFLGLPFLLRDQLWFKKNINQFPGSNVGFWNSKHSWPPKRQKTRPDEVVSGHLEAAWSNDHQRHQSKTRKPLEIDYSKYVEVTGATKKEKNSDFPLYWLFNRDPYHGLLQSSTT